MDSFANLGKICQTSSGGLEEAQAARAANAWLVIKRILDVFVAIILIVEALPLLVMLWILVSLDGGPGLYGHLRVGRNGQAFRCLKFRSMVVDADAALARYLDEDPAHRAEWEMSHKLSNDPRVTKLGRFLRTTSLDELPQLFNVLRGEMSIVGPRPVVQSELVRFYSGDASKAYLSVRPGLTGLWQVSGRSDVSYTKRVALDMEYVRSTSVGLDAKILCMTVWVVLLGKGAR